MTMRKWMPCVLLGLPVLLAVPLWATQPPPDNGQGPPKKFGKKEFPGGPGGFGGPFGQKRELVKQFDRNGDGWLNADERKEARAAARKQGGPGGFGGKKGFGKGPGRFGPGSFLAGPLMEALDADKDGKVTKAELAAGVKTFFADADKAKKGTLDEAAIADGLNRIIPRPKGFPGGPGGPGGKKRPGGFGPFGLGTPIAASVVKRADAKKTGQMTADDLVSAAAALFVEADRNKDGKLDEDELAAGVGLLLPTGGFGPPGGFGGKGRREPGKPGPRVAPADVRAYPDAGLYDPAVLRTIFLDFENADWEAELADFRNTDVEVPATLTVDGKKYPNVGVHFRGMSSYMMVPAGSKRSLNLSVDLADRKQRLLGHKTLNLLNAADDPTFLHTVLFAHVARQYIPAPKANFVKVVINGESWGVYVNAQQFNKDFIKENFNTTRGARWKVKGSPGGAGGLDYLGENVQDYKRRYTIKSKDTAKDWKALIELCRVLDRTPLDQLEAALTPILDIDGVLKFLALDNVTINQDGYWIRASDYNLYRDPKGKFHVIPHDTNETFAPTMGFGFGKGGPGFGAGGKGGGYALDPLVGLDDARKPLRSRLLAVPSLRKRYLEHVRTIAERSLDWKTLGPVVARYRALIEGEVERDTRKLYALTEFVAALADTPAADGRASRYNLRAFADGRRAYLLQHQAIRALERANDVKR